MFGRINRFSYLLADDNDDDDADDDNSSCGDDADYAAEGETTQDKKALKIVRIQERAITVMTVTDE